MDVGRGRKKVSKCVGKVLKEKRKGRKDHPVVRETLSLSHSQKKKKYNTRECPSLLLR